MAAPPFFTFFCSIIFALFLSALRLFFLSVNSGIGAGVCENAAIRKWKRWILLFIGVLISILLVYLCVRAAKMQREADGVAVETIRIYNVRETEDTEDTGDH